MYCKILIADLRPGMQVIDMGYSVRIYPDLYAVEGLIRCQEEIEDICRRGFTEVYIDADSAEDVYEDKVLVEALQKRQQHVARLEPQILFEEEYEKAQLAYANTLNAARELFEAARKGKILQMKPVENVINDVIQSTARNANALLALSMLHRRDEYSFVHSVNTAIHAALFGHALNLDAHHLYALCMAGFLHDIGKASVPLEILNAPRRLTDEEFEYIRQHPLAGYERIKDNPDISELTKLGVLDHHEKMNGSGYPYNKLADEISLTGKILAVVDVFEALTSDRPYKKALIPHRALGILYRMGGESLAMDLVSILVQCVGIYPPGSLVRLSKGEIAVVLQNNSTALLCPQILVIRTADNVPTLPRFIDLYEDRELAITESLDPSEFKVNIGSFFLSYSQSRGREQSA